jgi:putative ABC transport system permease protein
VVGVIEDFHIAKLSEKQEPVVFIHPRHYFNVYRYLTVNLDPRQMTGGIEQLRQEWQSSFAAFPFDYEFMDEKLAHIYQAEIRLREATHAATFVVLLILALGIINMTALNITFRTKEIGIRKVLGASVLQLYRRFINDYLLITGIALVVAMPLAYWMLQDWLQNFVYRTDIGWWVWLSPPLFILVLITALVVVQTTRTCLRNPADTLRYE